MYLEISLIVLSVAFLLLAAFAIPTFLQILRAARNISETLEILNKNLPDILQNLEGITANINQTTSTVQNQVAGLAVITQRVQGVMGFVMDMEQLLRGRVKIPFVQALSTVMAVGKGISVFLRVYRSGR